jgi:hypothetical protein
MYTGSSCPCKCHATPQTTPQHTCSHTDCKDPYCEYRKPTVSKTIITNTEEWEKEFDEQDFFQGNFVHGRTGFAEGAGTIGQVKGFIRDLITKTEADTLARVREKIENERLTDETGEPEDVAYNQALDDLLTSLTENNNADITSTNESV